MEFLKRLFGRNAPQKDTEDTSAASDWFIATAENSARGERMIFRLRRTRPSRKDLSELATAITIQWDYEGGSMPPADVNQAQLDFERALDPLTENSDAEVAQVSTGMGQKERVFYAKDREVFMAQMNRLLAGHPRYPLQITFYDDPDWKIWSDMLERLETRH